MTCKGLQTLIGKQQKLTVFSCSRRAASCCSLASASWKECEITIAVQIWKAQTHTHARVRPHSIKQWNVKQTLQRRSLTIAAHLLLESLCFTSFPLCFFSRSTCFLLSSCFLFLLKTKEIIATFIRSTLDSNFSWLISWAAVAHHSSPGYCCKFKVSCAPFFQKKK